MITSQYILEVLDALLDRETTSHIKNQITHLLDFEYEYTGVGVYVNFKAVRKIDEKYLANVRVISGVNIESPELDIGGTAILFFDKRGVIDFLEIVVYGDYYPNKDLSNYRIIQE